LRTVTIYKAPQKGKGQKLLENGFQVEDFPYNPPNADGKCYFTAPNSRSLAEEYNKYYKDGIWKLQLIEKPTTDISNCLKNLIKVERKSNYQSLKTYFPF